jgi:hypothetical protein
MTSFRFAFVVLLLAAAAALGQDVRVFANLDDGLAAAKKSGRPVLVVTRWRNGVCNSCDAWRDRVPRDADVQRQLARFEQVEWLYDGPGGKVIRWTKEHGGTSEDPAVQAFVVAADAPQVAVARAPLERVYAPAEFAKWLKEQAEAYEKAHPATKLRFAGAELVVEIEGTTTRRSCPAVDAARDASRPVLLYVFRGDRDGADKAAKAESAQCRRLEKAAFDSDAVLKATDGWVLVKLDLADADHAAYAKSLGVERAPALLALLPCEDKPQLVDVASVTSGDALAFKLKKLAAAK